MCLFCFLAILSLFSYAGIFGDANDENGLEDERLTRSEVEDWPKEFRSVGRFICRGQVQGSAVLLNFNDYDEPVVVTARHLTQGFELTDCHYAPESYEWGRAAVLSNFSNATAARNVEQLSSEDESQIDLSEKDTTTAESYRQDWLLLRLEPWYGWQQYAIQIGDDSARIVSQLADQNLAAHMVGFDLIKNQIVADYDCHFGTPEQTKLLDDDIDNLLWDNCDSERGSSGGALFAKKDDKLVLVGIRIGSLFDIRYFEGHPKVGDKFTLDYYINVSRILPL